MDERQREWERRLGPVAAGAAVAGLVLLIAQVGFQAIALSDAGKGDRGGLLAIHDAHGPLRCVQRRGWPSPASPWEWCSGTSSA